MKTIKIMALAMILGLIGMSAFAQQRFQGAPPDNAQREGRQFAPGGESGGPPSVERLEEVRKKIETIRIWRLTEELKLDVNTSTKLAALLSSVDLKRRDIHREQMETMRALRQSLRSQKPDDAKIKQLLEKFENNDRALQELKYSEIKGVKELLSVEQHARFVLFQQEFQREMQNMIAGARGGDQGERRPGQGGPRGSRAPRY